MNSILHKRLKTGGLLAIFLMITSLGFSQGTENFENIPANANNYATRVWTGTNGAIWTAEKARTDQTINGRAIAFTNVQNATLTTTIPGGIGDLTLTTKRIFAGNTGTISVSVGGAIVGTFPYGTAVQTTTISGINYSGDVVLILKTDGNNKIAIDDLTWTAATAVNTGPNIFNVVQTPAVDNVTSTDEVSVTADITDNDGIASAQLNWGTSTGDLSNSITMTNSGSGDNYAIETEIPAHAHGTTIYYMIEATDSNAVPATSTTLEMSYTVMDVMGVNNNNMLSGIHLFPNPLNDDTFYVYAPKLNGEQVEVKISDMAGRQVFSDTLNCEDNKLGVSVNNSLTSGVYLVTVNFEGEANTYRLVKQ